jgi:hypothetical protein
MVIRPLKPNEMTELFKPLQICYEIAYKELSLTSSSCS